MNCLKAHCYPPIGSDLDDVDSGDFAFGLKKESWNDSYVYYKEALDMYGRTLHTAAYFDREENIIFYAERSNSSGQSQQGIYWYWTKDDALMALKRVWAISMFKHSRFTKTNVPNNKRSLQHPDSMQPVSKRSKGSQLDDSRWEAELPTLPNVNWLDGKSKKCIWFEKPEGCKYGKKCINTHVVSPDFSVSPNIRQEEREQIFDKKYIHTKELVDLAGRRWYTAAFYNISEHFIVYAQRGYSSRRNSQGIYLYPSREEAITALEMAVYASAHVLVGRQRLAPTQQSHTEKSVTGNTKLFRKVVNANLSNVFIKIFPGQHLPKTAWHTSCSDEGLYTANFHSPAIQEKGAIYRSSENGGKYENGLWWYRDERSAKASAFVQFLKKAAANGLVSRNMTKTINGNTLM